MAHLLAKLSLAAVCAASALTLGGLPASAQAGPDMEMVEQLSKHAIADYAQFRRRGFVGRGYGYGPPRYYGRGYGRRGIGTGALIGGLAAGALIGGAIASQAAPAPVYVEPQGDATAYCMQRFRSYDPASGTYLGYDGLRHPCP